jgi:hypothetical protein
MTDAGSNALKGSILYTILVLTLLVAAHYALPGHLGDGWTAFLMLGAFIFLGSLWTTAGSRGWPSGLPSPWH